MTLHPIPLNFLTYEGNFIFFFISETRPVETNILTKLAYELAYIGAHPLLQDSLG
jgi:hypothetical protein